MVADLLKLPRDAFPLRTITTGATASNILGLGKPESDNRITESTLNDVFMSHDFHDFHAACGRDFAVRQALGTPGYSVAEDGFSGVAVKVLSGHMLR